MKCPHCGTANGKTNKFCRECGLRLESLVPVQQASVPATVDTTPGEVELGEELFKVWEVLRSGDLDSALAGGESMVRSNPDSASAHGLVALICERKAEYEFAEGRAGAAQDLLKRAAAQYERIIDLNPDSSADREKLAAIRRRIAGGVADGRWTAPSPNGVKTAFDAIPKPFLAAAGAVLAIVAVLVVLIPRAGGEREPAADAAEVKPAASTSGGLMTPNAPTGPPQAGYNYRQPTPPPLSAPSPAQPRQTRPTPRVEPTKIPSLNGKELTIVPESKKATPKREASANTGTTAPSASGGSSSGSKLLAQAIQLHNQGSNDEAVGAAERAIVLFQGDIDAGRNTDAAQRGIANAKKLIAVWEQSSASATEEQ